MIQEKKTIDRRQFNLISQKEVQVKERSVGQLQVNTPVQPEPLTRFLTLL